ncbi:hypothetical protein EON66_01215 [archaeon]|nr:MAG: hypothetical protein EON66_01215 [archaeon]
MDARCVGHALGAATCLLKARPGLDLGTCGGDAGKRQERRAERGGACHPHAPHRAHAHPRTRAQGVAAPACHAHVRATSLIRAPRALQISCALAAGVVFGAYLCHLTPDANEAFTAYLVKVAPGNDKLVGFPFAQVLSGAVFILLYAIDKLVVEKGMSGEEHAGHGKQCDHVSASIQSLADKTVPLAAEHAHAHALSEGPHHRHPHDVIDVPSARTVSNESDSSSVTADTSTLMHAKGRPSANSAQGRAAVMRAYTFFVALSVHSVFDGMSIGIESTMSGMIGVIIAVVRASAAAPLRSARAAFISARQRRPAP